MTGPNVEIRGKGGALLRKMPSYEYLQTQSVDFSKINWAVSDTRDLRDPATIGKEIRERVFHSVGKTASQVADERDSFR